MPWVVDILETSEMMGKTMLDFLTFKMIEAASSSICYLYSSSVDVITTKHPQFVSHEAKHSTPMASDMALLLPKPSVLDCRNWREGL